MALKALIFDCDGTLAETADVKRAAFNRAFSEAGLDWVWGRATYAQIIASALPGREVELFASLRHPDLFARMEGKNVFDAILARQRAICLDMLDSGAAPLRPGVARILSEAVQSGIKLAFSSTSPRAELEALLFVRFGLDMVKALHLEADTARATPLEAYRAALRGLGCRASEVVAIDDSAQGVAAAAGLGMTVIATPGYYTRTQKFRGASVVLSDLGHPAAPLTVLAGPRDHRGYVTLATLERWHHTSKRKTAAAVQAPAAA
ncbi:MAG: HAD family hydrolase [Paracoccaceae bacterium]